MSAKNESVVRPSFSGNAENLSIIVHALEESGDAVTVRPGLDVRPIVQRFDFIRPNPAFDPSKEESPENARLLVERRTQTYTPGGVASIRTYTATAIDGQKTEYVWWTTDGIDIPMLYQDGVVRETTYGRPKDADYKRPFYDLSPGTMPGETKPLPKLGGCFDTVTTTLYTSGLSAYFKNAEKAAPGEGSGKSTTNAYKAIRDGVKVGVMADVEKQLAGLANLPEAMRDQVREAMGLSDAAIEERIRTATEAAIAAKRAEVVATNAANPKAPAVDPETLTMDTKSA